MKQDVIFILSMDTEEEWDWSGDFPQKDFSVENTRFIPEFQAFCEIQKIRPTYFIDYAVANDKKSVERIKPALANNQCEIGAHLHSWCNPPYFGITKEKESHLVALPIKQVKAKLEILLELLQREFNIKPNSFRSGRWGINNEILKLLVEKNITIDSSMYPFYKNDYFNCENTPLEPYWPAFNNPENKGHQRDLMQIPVSVGFNHNHFPFLQRLYNKLNQASWKKLHLIGVFWALKLLRKIYLSPEVSSSADMITLVKSLLERKTSVIHMYLHSSSLLDHTTGVMDTNKSCEKICNRIRKVTEYLEKNTNVKYCTISEAAMIIKNRESNAN